MSVELQTPSPRSPRLDDDPFRIGCRYVRTVDADGRVTVETVPLTEEDFLHPQEGDRFMLVDQHVRIVEYIRYAIETIARRGLNVRVLSEHRVDWQVKSIKPHGPDVSVFRDFPADWDGVHRGTFPVRDEGAQPLAVIEVTSEATRHTDFEAKYLEYEAAGIPYYVIVDLAGPEESPKVLAFRHTRRGFRPMRPDASHGILLSDLHVWLRWQDGEVVAADEEGNDIPNSLETAELLERTEEQLDAVTLRASEAMKSFEAEKQRAEAEKQRAEAEKQRAEAALLLAEAEKQRADELARELTELKARMAQATTETGS